MAFLSPILFGAPALMGSFEAGTTGLLSGLTAGGVAKGALAAASIGSGIVGAAGNIQQGRAASDAALFNARALQQQADQDRAASGLEASEFVKKQRRFLAGASVGRTGGSGVLMSGSPLLVDEDTINEIAFREALIRHGGETRATRNEQQAALQTARAGHERTASYYRAGSSLLGTAAPLTYLYANA